MDTHIIFWFLKKIFLGSEIRSNFCKIIAVDSWKIFRDIRKRTQLKILWLFGSGWLRVRIRAARNCGMRVAFFFKRNCELRNLFQLRTALGRIRDSFQNFFFLSKKNSLPHQLFPIPKFLSLDSQRFAFHTDRTTPIITIKNF